MIQSAMLLPNIDKIMQKKSFIYSIKILTVCLLFHFQAIGQHPLLQSGPMPGYADMLEVMIWVQTTEAARVEILYQAEGKSDGPFHSNVVHTKKENAFTAHLIADTLEPGQRYTYKLFINNELVSLPYPTDFQTQKIWKWRGNPPNFTLLTGSCAYINQPEHDRPGTPYGGEYQIFTHMASHRADLMVWLGDNVYLREPDWNSKTGIQARYTHSRSNPEMQAFLASTHHYAIWDDHDYGPNDSDRGFYHKDLTLQTFKDFWANPGYGTSEMEGAITSFQWADADFFLLDNRWYRDPDNTLKVGKTILGKEQLQWLLDNLITSTATFKIVAMGGQFLTTSRRYETYHNNGYEEERQLIIDFIHKHAIKNVIFLTGDVHFTEMSMMKTDNKPTIYDLTFSTMSAGPNKKGNDWENLYRMEGTVVTKRNFGKISFRGELQNRELVVACYDSDNQLQWERIIKQE